jgi:hypothetical protein
MIGPNDQRLMGPIPVRLLAAYQTYDLPVLVGDALCSTSTSLRATFRRMGD